MSPYSFGILFHHHFLVPARVPGLVSLLFWHPVPSSFPGSGLGFRGLSPYSFGVLFYHHFLVPARVPGLVSLLFLASCSVIISWFRLGFRGLFPYSFGILFHHPFLVPARVLGLVSLLFCHLVPSSFPGSGQSSGACLLTLLASCSIIISWFRLGFRACLPTLLALCSIILSWFWLGFRGLSPYSFGIVFHHHVLVPATARVAGLASLLF